MGVQIPKTNFWATLSGNSGRGMEAVLNYIDNGIIIDQNLSPENKSVPTYQPMKQVSLNRLEI